MRFESSDLHDYHDGPHEGIESREELVVLTSGVLPLLCAEFKKLAEDEKGPAFKSLLKGESSRQVLHAMAISFGSFSLYQCP